MKKIYLTLLCGGLMLGSSCSRTVEKEPAPSTSNKRPIAKDTTWKTLTLREKIGQTMQVVATIEDHKTMCNGSIKEFMERYPVGSIFAISARAIPV